MKTIGIVGGGASGVFCAANLRMGKFKIHIFEKSQKLLSKVLISGGGRCNVTHRFNDDVLDFATNYPRGIHLLKKTLNQFSPKDTIKWFEDRGVKLKTEPDGRIFPVTNKSTDVIDCLLHQLRLRNVDIHTKCAVSSIVPSGNKYILNINNSELAFEVDYVVVATGGLQKMSHYGMFDIFNLDVADPVPSLFTFNLLGDSIVHLMGVSVNSVIISIKGTNFINTGPILITHWGFSGPAVLRLSAIAAVYLSKVKYDFKVLINWTGQNEVDSIEQLLKFKKTHSKSLLIKKGPFDMPYRLWHYLIHKHFDNTNLSWRSLSDKQLKILNHKLCHDEYEIKGKTTFKEEFVTAGGVKIQEINPKTMMCRKAENLFLTGEVLDVDGITGGFNFQHAWTSAFIVAESINLLNCEQ